jgi:hypothetical protein
VAVNGSTIFSDADPDLLGGRSGADWYLSDRKRDPVLDLQGGEVLDDLLLISG